MAHISQIQNGESMTLRQQLALTAKLSGPAIMAQLSTILMQYIDASMVEARRRPVSLSRL